MSNELPKDDVNLVNSTSVSMEQTNPDDIFAAFHLVYYPRFKMLTRGLSKTRLLKLLWSVGDIPTAEKLDKIFTKEQKEAYLILDKLLLARFSMVFGNMLSNATTAMATEDDSSSLKINETKGKTDGEL